MTHADILNFLITLPLFGAANPSLLQKAVVSEQAHRITLAASETLLPRFGEMLGVVLSGKLQILSADTERAVVLRTAAKGHVFGAASLFLEVKKPVSRLVAKSDATLFFLTRDAVHDLLCADPDFMDAYLRFLAERVQFLNAKIRSFTAGSAERRLALWLADHPEGEPFPAGALTALAKTLDIGRASLYRALDKMEDEKLIIRNGREITVPSAENLLKKYHS